MFGSCRNTFYYSLLRVWLIRMGLRLLCSLFNWARIFKLHHLVTTLFLWAYCSLVILNSLRSWRFIIWQSRLFPRKNGLSNLRHYCYYFIIHLIRIAKTWVSFNSHCSCRMLHRWPWVLSLNQGRDTFSTLWRTDYALGKRLEVIRVFCDLLRFSIEEDIIIVHLYFCHRLSKLFAWKMSDKQFLNLRVLLLGLGQNSTVVT